MEVDALSQDEDGYTPLMWACARGHVETALILYKYVVFLSLDATCVERWGGKGNGGNGNRRTVENGMKEGLCIPPTLFRNVL